MKALICNNAEGDEQRFYSVALQVAAQVARQRHGRFAQERPMMAPVSERDPCVSGMFRHGNIAKG